eukprot:Gb_37417 [translate_table: standard]
MHVLSNAVACAYVSFTVKDRANEIYKKVEDLKSIRGRNQDAILAACLYIACRQEDKPRTVKVIAEICSVANGASKKEIGRAKEFIVKQLEEEMGKSMEMGTIHAGDFLVCPLSGVVAFGMCLCISCMCNCVFGNLLNDPQLRRFCSHLNMTNQAVKAATEAVKRSEELDIRLSHNACRFLSELHLLEEVVHIDCLTLALFRDVELANNEKNYVARSVEIADTEVGSCFLEFWNSVAKRGTNYSFRYFLNQFFGSHNLKMMEYCRSISIVKAPGNLEFTFIALNLVRTWSPLVHKRSCVATLRQLNLSLPCFHAVKFSGPAIWGITIAQFAACMGYLVACSPTCFIFSLLGLLASSLCHTACKPFFDLVSAHYLSVGMLSPAVLHSVPLFIASPVCSLPQSLLSSNIFFLLCTRRSPISIAAAAIYIISQLSDDKKLLRDISRATGVAEGTIRNSYKDLYPHATKLIPDWFAKEEDLKNLCAP